MRLFDGTGQASRESRHWIRSATGPFISSLVLNIRSRCVGQSGRQYYHEACSIASQYLHLLYSPPMNEEGFVTAGGLSSRMRSDKALLEIGGRAMIEHIIAALQPVTTRVAIIANNPDYKRLGLPVFADSNRGIGPLE